MFHRICMIGVENSMAGTEGGMEGQCGAGCVCDVGPSLSQDSPYVLERCSLGRLCLSLACTLCSVPGIAAGCCCWSPVHAGGRRDPGATPGDCRDCWGQQGNLTFFGNAVRPWDRLFVETTPKKTIWPNCEILNSLIPWCLNKLLSRL